MYIDIELYFILNDINLHMTCIYMYDIPDMYICMYVCMSVCSDVSMYLYVWYTQNTIHMNNMSTSKHVCDLIHTTVSKFYMYKTYNIENLYTWYVYVCLYMIYNMCVDILIIGFCCGFHLTGMHPGMCTLTWKTHKHPPFIYHFSIVFPYLFVCFP